VDQGSSPLASNVCVVDLAALIHAETLLLLRSFISSPCTLPLPFSLCRKAKRSTDTVTQVNASSQAPITRRFGSGIWNGRDEECLAGQETSQLH
jgi:hypothetical protein